MAKTVDEYISANTHWNRALKLLREICRNTEMQEEVKWGAPCYTVNGKNVVGIGGFKSYVGLWFHQGVFLKDPHHLLEQSNDMTKGLRKMMFQSPEEIEKREDTIKEYIHEAIQNQKAGKEIAISRRKSISIPPELQDHFDKDPSLQKAFEKFTRGRKREFAEYIESAKLPATKTRRIEKISKMILKGTGLYDKYQS